MIESGIAAPLPFEQFFTSDPLAVTAVPDLQPSRRSLQQVRAGFQFGDNAFEIMLSRQSEKSFAVLFDVVTIQELLPRCGTTES
jgi:hypothetical protein